MALYADENFPLRVIEELRRLGQDVLTVFEDGRATQSIIDFDILARATERQGNRYSQSCRFQKVHIRMPGHAGIIICTKDPDRIGQAQRIAEAIAEAGDLRAKLIRVYRPTSAR
jgi:extradiol dioxygenase family protein